MEEVDGWVGRTWLSSAGCWRSRLPENLRRGCDSHDVVVGGRAREDALDRGARVRVLMTDYLAITDPDALTQLADLASGGDRRLEVRLFGGGSAAFHPKAYIVWSSAGEAAAGYVGSSNLSASGVDGGVEWNLGVDRVEQAEACVAGS
ncbi:MAG: phospholipase D-like domain-containing protein [bacterium]|nr:phospholipase D-like domain-containing protein [bacterium]